MLRLKRVGIAVSSLVALGLAYAFQSPSSQAQPVAPLLSISPQSLQGHLSFIASDLCAGRATPSAGQAVAAEYIAAQFRRAGLEPAGNQGFFQWAGWPLGSGQPYARVCNVIGLLRGSDPKLRDTYIIVSAHYDHLGVDERISGDQIYNGANDDGSGTVSVIELASALGAMKQRPRRSIVFMTFFGEELGLLGSKFYCSNPVFPLTKTVADINLEQLGRYDAPDGPRPSSFNLTGFDYTNMGEAFAAIGAQNGVNVYGDGENSDSFFARSDNQSFANAGVPAHTFSAALEYGDYHQPGDEWQKIDYLNMAKLVRVIGLGVLAIADSETTPKWNAANPKASKYAALRPG